MANANASDLAALAAFAGSPSARIEQMALLVSFDQSATIGAVPELYLLASIMAEPTARVTEMALLVAYTTGTPVNTRRRCWTFDFDGHQFYVLDLAQEGTFCFDLTTGMWCEFETQGHEGWNMRNGTTWKKETVALDFSNPIVWKLDPSSQLDEDWKDIEHVVTAMHQFRFRKARRQDALRVTASVGQLGEDASVLKLRFSDDLGQTWSDYYEITLNDADYTQEIAFRSLGTMKAPGRIFEISDTAGFLRIDGANIELEGLAEDAKQQQPG
jgi:hypothetical protein